RRGWRTPGRATCRAGPPAARRGPALLHPGNGLARGGDAPHDLLHHVGLHVAVEELLLVLLGEQLGVVERHVARDLDVARRQVLGALAVVRSEEHTSELQSRENLVCRLLLEKKKKKKINKK